MPDPINVSVNIADLANALAPGDVAALGGGRLDEKQVWFEYLTQQDSKVRPSHAALHGTVWRVGDPNAPVPPIDYGCRCFIKYVSKPGSPAAQILPPAPTLPTTQADAWGKYLDKQGINWEGLLKEVSTVPAGDRLGALALKIQAKLGNSLADARNMAQMALATQRTPVSAVRARGTVPKPTPPVVPPPPPVVPPPKPTPPVEQVATVRESSPLEAASASLKIPASQRTAEDWKNIQAGGNVRAAQANAEIDAIIKAAPPVNQDAPFGERLATRIALNKSIHAAVTKAAGITVKQAEGINRSTFRRYNKDQANALVLMSDLVSTNASWKMTAVGMKKIRGRAWASRSQNTIFTEGRDTPDTHVHEMAHTMEFANPNTEKAAVAFLQGRTQGKPLQQIYKENMGQAAPWEVYRDANVGSAYTAKDYGAAFDYIRDKAISRGWNQRTMGEGKAWKYYRPEDLEEAGKLPAYTSKPNPNGTVDPTSTELLSKGMEAFVDNPAGFKILHPDHFDFVLKSLMGGG